MTDLDTILARLSAAEGPDREIDAEISIALIPKYAGWIKHPNLKIDSPSWMKGELWPDAKQFHAWLMGKGAASSEHAQPFTGSVDAAIALAERVLPGWHPLLGRNIHHNYWQAMVQIAAETEEGVNQHTARHSEAAIALCIATIRALRAKGGGE